MNSVDDFPIPTGRALWILPIRFTDVITREEELGAVGGLIVNNMVYKTNLCPLAQSSGASKL